ncbi:MAG TPA: DUF5606 domain-containing protein [Bacteroidales bacterium]|jgi:hypothetical protein|nr:DUF5606 domain-containing protein [Bacteroidales bacterium]
MDLKKILIVSGKSGLFYIVNQGKDRIIVESIQDKSRHPIFPSNKVISLEDISIFTNAEEVPLKKVFLKIFELENGQKCIDNKSDSNALKTYMEKVLPEYDRERVYVSDMKKLFSWYNLLIEHNMLNFDDIKKEEEEKEKKTEENSSDNQ